MPFTATTTGRDTLGMRSILEDFANAQGINCLEEAVVAYRSLPRG